MQPLNSPTDRTFDNFVDALKFLSLMKFVDRRISRL